MEEKPVDIGLTWKPQDKIEIQAVGVLILSQLKFDAQKAFCSSNTSNSKSARKVTSFNFSMVLFWVVSQQELFLSYCLPLMMRMMMDE